VGEPFAEATYQGPQVTKKQYESILSYIERGKSEKATLVCGGGPVDGTKGYYISPTVFSDVTDDMTIYQEEIFGPVVVISSFETEDEAVTRANNTTYGLGAAVFTTDLERAHRVSAEIEAGMVWVNSSQDCDPRIPFGGVKQSGIGRELGEAGLEAYSQIKAVHINMGNKL
jgi:aldehyde dehydrogenase (NAD+)